MPSGDANPRVLDLLRGAACFVTFYALAVVAWLRQCFFGRRKSRDIASADLTGRTILVTGAGAGIGRALAHELVAIGANVVCLCLAAESGPPGVRSSVSCDFRELSQVEHCAEQVQKRHGKFHAVVHCAGVMFPPEERTSDGVETTLQVNCFAPVLLTRRLQTERVIYISSEMHRCFLPELWCSDLVSNRRSRYEAYALSKVAAHLLLESSWRGIPAIFVHPGVVRTGLYLHERAVLRFFVLALGAASFWTPERAAREVTWQVVLPCLASDPAGLGRRHGMFFNVADGTVRPTTRRTAALEAMRQDLEAGLRAALDPKSPTATIAGPRRW